MINKALTFLLLVMVGFTICTTNAIADTCTLQGQLQGTYQCNSNMTSQGTCTVEPAATATCTAILSITLNPGFYAKSGSTFTANLSDADGLPNSWELQYFGNLNQGPNDDPDNDQLTNLQEYNLGLDPTNPDIDSDGLKDGWEIQYFGNLDQGPNDDSDNDQLTNLQEYQLGTDPTDGDPDNDDDGLLDWWELQYFSNLSQGPNDDNDNDGLTNLQEYNLGLNPVNPDTDSDGLSDGWEQTYFGNQNQEPNGDPDSDGITNIQEYVAGTDPGDQEDKPTPGYYYEYDTMGRVKSVIKVIAQ